MKDTSWDHALEVTADGNGLVGHAGGMLLRKLADQIGLTSELDTALTRKGTFPQISRGMVLVSTAVAIAMGGTAMADIEVLGQLEPVLGDAPSGSTVRRVLDLATGLILARVAQARARIRIVAGACAVHPDDCEKPSSPAGTGCAPSPHPADQRQPPRRRGRRRTPARWKPVPPQAHRAAPHATRENRNGHEAQKPAPGANSNQARRA